ncbi:DUF2249 domain-containing protein [Corynebacterium vitaeruminis]|uniref:DUF2249 domain-containing protein n=1 Tax=Corynebacterium vitaeruminis DSM 20294 TaxID=1224164 RepID=W5XXY8_9CORY|nr:DUF2249 domain-containing protein [Corynebacterium vitaeruminis]AHI21861.1 hypothetical protein B843_02345 [Corynebacterium vitaeruminis DSM 20294]
MVTQLPIAGSGAEAEIPTLNAAIIPHAIRHGAIHGALNSRGLGESMILIAPHNPIPLLREIEAGEHSFDLTYLKEGPDDWHLKFTRVG